jgi:tungstate transport system ATP-binding protein
MSSEVVLALREIEVRRRAGTVLRVKELSVPNGMRLGIVGPNGAGKSTLLQISGGLLKPAAGVVELNGEQVTRWSATRLRRQTAMVFQDSLLFHRSVLDNAASGLVFHGVSRTEARHQAMVWLERFGVAHLATRDARALSGGEAQRVNLARAFAVQPLLILLDEPLAGLDGPTRARLVPELSTQLRISGATAMMVTHEPAEAVEICTHLAVMIDGSIAQMGPVDDVMARPASEHVAYALGQDIERGGGSVSPPSESQSADVERPWPGESEAQAPAAVAGK